MLVSSFVLLAAAGASSVVGTVLDKRAADTSAICSSDFSWTDNSANISPCRLASIVSATCHGSTWNVPPLPDVHHSYTPPNAVNKTLETCSCSWIAYNLFAACSACQGFEPAVLAWGEWNQNCVSNAVPISTFPIPVLPDGTEIPYYAVHDPSTWESQRWNTNEAHQIALQNQPDVTQTTATQHKKSTPVGPIVGGVIGGLAALLIAGGIAFWIHSKKKKGTTRAPTAPSVSSEGMTTLGYGSPQGHMRQISDMSNKSIGLGYQNLGNSFVTSSITNTRGPASPTSMHTHTGSVNSLSYFGSVQNSVAPYATTASPPPVTLSSPVPPVPALPPAQAGEHVITPFTLVPSQSTRTTSPNSGYPSDRKRADGAIIPVYDSPNSLPSDIGGGGGRARFNPPAYTDYTAGQPFDSASQAPSRPIHTKKGSADTVTTIASPISPISPISPVTQGTGVNTHISGLDDIIGQLGLNNGNGTNLGAPTVSGTGGTLATGQSMGMNPVQGSRQQGPFRPTNVHEEEPEI